MVTKNKQVDATTTALRSVYADSVKYLDQYFFFENPAMVRVLALWAMATWCLKSFDSFGYLAIWATLKRCGKSRLGESMTYLARNGNIATDVTAAALFGAIDQAGEDGTCLMIDEAEKLSADGHPLRETCNVGCYRAAGVMRAKTVEGDRTFEKFDVFGPKIFVLIGNVFDTLRDRSISVEMSRMIGQTKKTYLRMFAKAEGEEIGKRMNPIAAELQQKGIVRDMMIDVMTTTEDVDSRDLEMWCPVLTMGRLLHDDDEFETVINVAKRLVFKATSPAQSHQSLRDRENVQVIADFAPKALKDLATLAQKHGHLPTETIAARLIAHNDMWALFKGTGITNVDISAMLNLHGVDDTTVRAPKTNGRKQIKGDKQPVYKAYRAEKIIAAAKKAGVL